MATSAITFQGYLVANSTQTEGELRLNFTPPSNLAGKLCYIQLKSWTMTWSTGYSNPTQIDTFFLKSNWNQIQAATLSGETTTTSERQLPASLLATKTLFENGNGPPILANMPPGPHTVSFIVNRSGGGALSAATANDCYMTLIFEIVPAAGRTAPIS